MDEAQLAEIKTKIEAQILKTRESIETYKELTKPISPENAIGRISRMDAINNKSVNEAALRKAKIKLKNLELALKRIHEPEFGLCARCKNPIPIGRILLVPQSRFCVNCAK